MESTGCKRSGFSKIRVAGRKIHWLSINAIELHPLTSRVSRWVADVVASWLHEKDRLHKRSNLDTRIRKC